MENIKSRKRWGAIVVALSLILLAFFSYNSLSVEASGTVIVVNPGHLDGVDSGAVNSSNGIREVDLNNTLAIKIVSTLRANGYNAMLSHPIPGNPGLPTLLTSNPDYNVYSTTICNKANSIGADLLLSVHHNSGGTTASGYELYWSSYHPSVDNNGIYEVAGLWSGGATADLDSTPPEIALRSKELANTFNEKFKSLGYVPCRNRVIERDDAITRKTSMPSVLIEAGFVSNPSESVAMANGTNQQKMADQVLASVQGYYGTNTDPMTATGVTASVSGTKITATIKGVTAPNGIQAIWVPIWSDTGGQNDLKWYKATKQSDGNYIVTIDIKDHNYDEGTYQIHVYGTDNNSKTVFLGNATASVKIASTPMTATSVTGSVSGTKITATIKGVTAPDGIKSIVVPTWSSVGGQDDIKWYDATKQSDGSYSVTIDIKDHNYDGGTYYIHTYGTDNYNKTTFLGDTTVNVAISSMSASGVTASFSGNKITATVTGVTAPNGINSMVIPIWSDVGGQDDLKWYTATKQSDGSYSVTIDIKDHNYDNGSYSIHVYGSDNNNKMTFLGNASVNISTSPMTAKEVKATVSENIITVTVNGITAPNGIKSILIPTWSDAGGQDDLKWYTGTLKSDGSYQGVIDAKNHNKESGTYSIHVYGVESSGKTVFLGNASASVRYVETPIMGATTVTAAELVAYYKGTGSVYPQIYNDRGVNLETFVNMYIQECNAEGVRAEVAFAQAMLETGNLKFGGDVKAGQFNFAGLGATGGVPGFDFAAKYGDNSTGLQTGIRGHVQHLKCYASTEPLNQTKVDPRWNDTLRLKAMSVEELAGTWAADTTYATKLKALMNKF